MIQQEFECTELKRSETTDQVLLLRDLQGMCEASEAVKSNGLGWGHKGIEYWIPQTYKSSEVKSKRSQELKELDVKEVESQQN